MCGGQIKIAHMLLTFDFTRTWSYYSSLQQLGTRVAKKRWFFLIPENYTWPTQAPKIHMVIEPVTEDSF